MERFPLAVLSAGRDGATLMHYAIQKEDDRLLSVLLEAKIPMFWLPTDHTGMDILQAAVNVKSRWVRRGVERRG